MSVTIRSVLSNARFAMHQAQIKALLEEATHAPSLRRKAEIQAQFAQAVYPGEKGQGIQAFLEALFVSTIENHRDYLPKLLPAFVLLCGDREDAMFGTIDWSGID